MVIVIATMLNRDLRNEKEMTFAQNATLKVGMSQTSKWTGIFICADPKTKCVYRSLHGLSASNRIVLI